MFAVALIGVDGAGKTTIAKKLIESFPMPIKYIYMGTSILSSNFALPTSRLIFYLKLRSYRMSARQLGSSLPEFISNHDLEYRDVKRSRIGATARMLNRMAEEWFRQVIAWCYRIRGYLVLYDRHFIFEYTPKSIDVQKHNQRLTDRLHLWFLDRLYPIPDLVILLDASLDVLLKRKKECPLDHLQRHRKALREQAKKMANFVRINADQPLEKVYEEVCEHLIHYLIRKHPDGQLSRIRQKQERKIAHE